MKLEKPLLFTLLAILISLSSYAQDPTFPEYKSEQFSFEGHDAKVIFPNKPNAEKLWIWRARFWGHEPQLDKALLDRGFHVVYVDVANLYGNDEAVEIWDNFYKFCRKNYGLNKKVVLEGMSRGGLIIYNWAAQNTKKVFSIYADAPVCDIKSWPGGLYAGKGSPVDWERCLAAYGLDANTVLEFKGIPIYNSIKVAKAGIPVIHVYGDSDEVVPYEENTALLAEQFRMAGGTIVLIPKEGIGHHPHSLKDPTPLVEFIMKSIQQ
ncbi:alpha/beta fold hydrolase [Algoriphagus chordae]|uniref:Prolyl oligopeptidase family protein n=1 Tax=Algoriphagus chordae TaxID=237019 RepID=A0A2W7S8U6_9BACT|nr:alpha/beta hydrolase [Algoriphagus chordae]PZX46982.1 hypothetical protein LV85_04079 [Algoriphagus chordae]